jgi:hypothetical protein
MLHALVASILGSTAFVGLVKVKNRHVLTLRNNILVPVEVPFCVFPVCTVRTCGAVKTRDNTNFVSGYILV